ncbi:hypothetical protein IGI04_017088 [Brassica rapa subsp. trilocularis]|uniref:E3 ubiquitin-protein ligase RMA n=1 Tax=Brassica rapa subsp. trilocularis TaxID=1813537 RepID=A0ABQ7MUV2_BRACM|nr:hypothetical protein IGI04_017088 [Brassica rapa subsp. trilocularis]
MERTNSTVPGDYFDCNICLENAQDPLPLIYLNVKECPVCDGKVTDTEVIPVYGNGDDSESSSNAKRITNRAVPFIPGSETVEHFRIGLQALAQGDEFGLSNIVFVNVLIKKKKA